MRGGNAAIPKITKWVQSKLTVEFEQVRAQFLKCFCRTQFVIAFVFIRLLQNVD